MTESGLPVTSLPLPGAMVLKNVTPQLCIDLDYVCSKPWIRSKLSKVLTDILETRVK